MPDKKEQHGNSLRVAGVRSISGVKDKVEKMPNQREARKGYDAFLAKRGLKPAKWKGFRATGKRKTEEP